MMMTMAMMMMMMMMKMKMITIVIMDGCNMNVGANTYWIFAQAECRAN